MMNALPSNHDSNSTPQSLNTVNEAVLNDSVFCSQPNGNNKNSNINIGLIDYKNFSNEDLLINVSEIDEYFDKDVSLSPLNKNKTSSSLQQSKKYVKFTIATFTKFNFDFLRLSNSQNFEIKIYLNFKINDRYRKIFEFKIIKSELFIPGKLNISENFAFLIPYESGQYLVEIHISPFNTAKMSTPHKTIIVECLLKVVDVNLQRISNIFQDDQSDCQVISIDCLEGDSLLSNVLFKMKKPISFNQPFFLKINLENQSQWITFTRQFEGELCSKMKFFYLSPWSCLISFLEFSDFFIKLNIRSPSSALVTNLLSLYACDSLTPSLSVLLASYEVNVNCLKKYPLRERCIQASLANGSGEIFLCKWTRIDLTNRDKSKHVKVDIRLAVNGVPVDCRLLRWRCTQTQLVMQPHSSSAVLLYLNKPLFATGQHGPDDEIRVELLLEQTGGQLLTQPGLATSTLTTRFPVHFDTCH